MQTLLTFRGKRVDDTRPAALALRSSRKAYPTLGR